MNARTRQLARAVVLTTLASFAALPCAGQGVAAPSTPAPRNAAELIESRMPSIYDESTQTPAVPDAPAGPTAATPTPSVSDSSPALGAPSHGSGPGDAAHDSRTLPPPQPSASAQGFASRLTDAEPAPRLGEGRAAKELPRGESRGGWVLNTLAALGVVIALALALRWAYTKLAGRSVGVTGSRAVETLSRTALAPRNHVLLLRVGRRVLIVNDSAHGMRTLAEVDDPEEVAELLAATASARPDSMSTSFNGLLARFTGGHVANSDRAATIDADAYLPDRRHEGGDDREGDVDRARDQLSRLLSRVRTTGGQAGGGA